MKLLKQDVLFEITDSSQFDKPCWPSGRAADYGLRGRGLNPVGARLSLSKT